MHYSAISHKGPCAWREWKCSSDAGKKALVQNLAATQLPQKLAEAKGFWQLIPSLEFLSSS